MPPTEVSRRREYFGGPGKSHPRQFCEDANTFVGPGKGKESQEKPRFGGAFF